MWGQGESGSALGSGSGAFNNTTVFDLEDNATLSCAARNIQDAVMLPYSTTGTIIVRALHALFLLFTFFAGGFFNLLVIVLVAKYKKLHTASFGIALQIVILDLLLSAVISLVSLTSTIANCWVFGEHVYALVGIIVYVGNLVRIASILVFVVDRFLSVFCPFAYPKYQFKTVVILSTVSWLFIMVVGIIGYILDCYTFVPFVWLCAPAYDGCNIMCSLFFGLSAAGIIIPCRIISLLLYTMLFIKARKARKAITSLTQTGGSGSITKYDWKATTTFFNLFISVFAFSLPGVCSFLSSRVYSTQEKESRPYCTFLLSLLVSSVSLLPISDPILILRNGDVKEVIGEFKVILRRKVSSTCESEAI